MNVKELINPGAAVGLAIYGLGYGIGFASGAYILNKKWSERYDSTLADEIEKSKAFYRVLLKKDVSPEELAVDVEFEDSFEDEVVDDEDDEYVDILKDYRPSQTTEEAVAVVKEVFPEAKVIRKEKDYSDIREITRDDVRYLSDDIENTELTFFRGDGVLCHEDGGIIYHPEMVIGMDQFKALDEIPEDQTRIYLLSEAQSQLWLIDLESGAYADTYIQHSVRMPNHSKTPRFRVNDE